MQLDIKVRFEKNAKYYENIENFNVRNIEYMLKLIK
jgi:hypothetical protein